MFSETLKKLRKAKGLTQRQLADMLFCDCSSVTKWETGKANPDFEKQQKLAEIFNVSIDYLLGRTGENSSPALNTQISEQEALLLKESADLTDAEKQDVLEYIRFKKSQKQKLSASSGGRTFTTADFEDNTERIAAFGGMEDTDEEPLTT